MHVKKLQNNNNNNNNNSGSDNSNNTLSLLLLLLLLLLLSEFLTSQLWLGNFHLSRDAVIKRIRLGCLICSFKRCLQLNMCQELQTFAFVYMYSGASLVLLLLLKLLLLFQDCCRINEMCFFYTLCIKCKGDKKSGPTFTQLPCRAKIL